MLYGYDLKYLVNNYTINEIRRLWEYGYKYDMERRGYEFKDTPSEDEWDAIRKELYTEEEYNAQMEAKGG